MRTGVPQSSVLSSTLFSLYTNDIPIPAKREDTKIALFADDTVIIDGNDDQTSPVRSHRTRRVVQEVENRGKRRQKCRSALRQIPKTRLVAARSTRSRRALRDTDPMVNT
ncbi:unnamed protein product [Euphydryas editha]|uniref:Reverse transcriptase domain-containing protein n=1 Tax=Euphydryas editha TaxID=104508 RepID=A0AAU9TXD3_EUPED|nr:unnamed protein product [Euphydryas editha]